MRKKTDAQFKQEVKNLVGGTYTFLEPYQGTHTKIKVKHNKCGHIYKAEPNSFLQGKRCPYCYGNTKKTDADFKKEAFDLVGDEYTFLDTYANNHTKLRVKHNKCGKVYKIKPYSFLRGDRCPYCVGLIRKTDTQFKQEVFDLVGDEYTFLDTYVNNHTKLRVKHNKCGKVYEVRPNDFLKGTRCPHCFGNTKKTDAQFKKEVYDLVGDEYTFLDTYVNNHTKLRVRHNHCGNTYEVRPNAFFKGDRCPYCAKKNDVRFKKEVFDLVNNEYTFLEPYINAKAKIKVKHNKCGHVYEVRPTDFISHHARCPYCNSPKGEDIINRILKSLGIKYEYQKAFSDLKDTHPLSYDFYIPSQSILIEYQGIQHYQAIGYFGGEDRFKLQQKHDQMKLDYARDNGYNLIAVPYTKDTFSKIKKYLLNHGLSA